MEMLESYLLQVKKYSLLSAEEEIALSKKIKDGDKKALDTLIKSNLRLVISIAKKFTASNKFSMMDLIQEGNMGLMAAASKYNYSFSTRFSTYAYTWILQYMLRFIYNKTSMISLPHRKEELLRKIITVQNDYSQNYGREPSITELSECIGISEEEISSVLAFTYSVTSIDYECSEDGSSTLGDFIYDNKYCPERELMNKEERKSVMKMINLLPKNERDVIYHRYNLNQEQHVPTLRELSKVLGVSAETVRQMEIRAVTKMKKIAMNYERTGLVTA